MSSVGVGSVDRRTCPWSLETSHSVLTLQAPLREVCNYLISNELTLTISCGISDFSTCSTREKRGPARSRAAISNSWVSSPAATTSTRPSGRLRTQPRRPRLCPWRAANHRKPTPCTSPAMSHRAAATATLRIALGAADAARRSRSRRPWPGAEPGWPQCCSAGRPPAPAPPRAVRRTNRWP